MSSFSKILGLLMIAGLLVFWYGADTDNTFLVKTGLIIFVSMPFIKIIQMLINKK